MVVVFILATAVSLISSAVVKGMDKNTVYQTRSEIAEMEVALRPYAFFSSTGINNKYAVTTDNGAYPYMTGVGQFTNPNAYQIISAGMDGNFGGSMWAPSSGATGYGADDQANFSSSLLGAGQN